MRERRVLYTVEEAAHLLGISPSTVHRWAREGELRTIPLGGRMVVPASSLEQLLGTPAAGESSFHDEENLNQVAIAGRLLAVADVRESRTGVRYATMRLGVAGHGPSSEPFHVVVLAFGVRVDGVAGLQPGTLVRVDGRLAERRWTAEDGTRIRAQRIVAERIRTLADAASVAS